jgi:hypothetical protein
MPNFLIDDWPDPELYEELSWDLPGFTKAIHRNTIAGSGSVCEKSQVSVVFAFGIVY